MHAGYRFGDVDLSLQCPVFRHYSGHSWRPPRTPDTIECIDFRSLTVCALRNSLSPGTPADSRSPGFGFVWSALSSVPIFSFAPNIRVGGVQAGYNVQITPFWLVGIEGDLSWGQGKSSQLFQFRDPVTGVLNGQSFTVRTQWSASLRARLGFIAGTWLFYGTGGGAFLRVNVDETGLPCGVIGGCVPGVTETFSSAFSVGKNLLGWTLGVGAERLLWNDWLVRLEYLFADFGHVDFGNMTINSFYSDTIFCLCSGSATATGNVSGTVRTQTVRVGISKKFP